jgi:signal transduction histidine kinase
MMTGMDEPARRRQVAARPVAVLAGAGGCLLLTVAAWPMYLNQLASFIDTPTYGPTEGLGWDYVLATMVATVVALCAVRWWPYLLLAAAVVTGASVLYETGHLAFPSEVALALSGAYPLAVVGMLACAQGLVRGAPGWCAAGWGAAVAGLAMGGRLAGTALRGPFWLASRPDPSTTHVVLAVAGLACALPAVWWYRRGDPAAVGPATAGEWRRVRLVVPAVLAVCLPIPLSFLTTRRLAALLGVAHRTLEQHSYVDIALLGAIAVAAATVLAAVAGLWPLGGALTAATAQTAAAAPLIIALTALAQEDLVRLLAAFAGMLLGVAVAASRLRIPLAAALAVVVATALFIVYGAMGGQPTTPIYQRGAVPAVAILVLTAAAATAIAGATAPLLASRGALPAALGPLAVMLVGGGLQTEQATHTRYGRLVSPDLEPWFHLPTSAVLLLAAGAGIAGLGLARQFAVRRAERKQAEEIRREAAVAERERLARPIHDGVLQVLALVKRHGSELGGQGGELAALAGEQEVALRSLLASGTGARRDGTEDLRASLQALASPAIDVATPARPVVLPVHAAAELTAAVRAALDNVRRHAGTGARAWVLVEDESGGVRVTVRDDGVGFGPHRLAEAAEAGRLGVAQSMRGRIGDCGGTTTITSSPGEGTEVEFWVPRRPG